MELSQKSESWGTQDQSWINSRHGLNNCKPATLAVALFDPEDHFTDDGSALLSGLPIAKVTAAGANQNRFGPYDGTATDGRQTLVGHLLSDVPTPPGVGVVVGAVLMHGQVKLANLPVTLDDAGQADAAGRIIYS